MSDTAGAVAVETTPTVAPSEAAPATPAPETAPVAPEGTPEVRAIPTNAREARALTKARAQGRMGREPKVEAPTKPNRAGEAQPIDAAGRYAPKGESKVEAPKEAVAAPAPTAAVESPAIAGATAAPEVPKVPEVRAELPEWHTLRKDRGKRYLDELAPHEMRAVTKDLGRVAELERERSDLRTQLARFTAEQEIRRDPAKNPLSDPKNRARYDDILQTYGQEAADAFRKGLEGDVSAEINRKAQEITQRETTVRVAQQFKADLAAFMQEAASSPTMLAAWKTGYGELERQVGSAASEYGALVEDGYRPPTIDGFKEYLRLKYVADPRAVALFRQQQAATQAQTQQQIAAEAQAKAEADAAAREAEALADAARRRGQNPLGRLPVPGTGAGGAVGPRNAREAVEARKARRMGRLRG